MKLRLPLFLASLLLAAMAVASRADEFTWTSTSSSASWREASNWNPAEAPGLNYARYDTVIFNNALLSAATTITLSGNVYLNQLISTADDQTDAQSEPEADTGDTGGDTQDSSGTE